MSGFHKDILTLDAPKVVDELAAVVERQVTRRLNRQGVMLAVTGFSSSPDSKPSVSAAR